MVKYLSRTAGLCLLLFACGGRSTDAQRRAGDQALPADSGVATDAGLRRDLDSGPMGPSAASAEFEAEAGAQARVQGPRVMAPEVTAPTEEMAPDVMAPSVMTPEVMTPGAMAQGMMMAPAPVGVEPGEIVPALPPEPVLFGQVAMAGASRPLPEGPWPEGCDKGRVESFPGDMGCNARLNCEQGSSSMFCRLDPSGQPGAYRCECASGFSSVEVAVRGSSGAEACAHAARECLPSDPQNVPEERCLATQQTMRSGLCEVTQQCDRDPMASADGVTTSLSRSGGVSCGFRDDVWKCDCHADGSRFSLEATPDSEDPCLHALEFCNRPTFEPTTDETCVREGIGASVESCHLHRRCQREGIRPSGQRVETLERQSLHCFSGAAHGEGPMGSPENLPTGSDRPPEVPLGTGDPSQWTCQCTGSDGVQRDAFELMGSDGLDVCRAGIERCGE